MAYVHSTGQLAELLWPGITEIWGISYKAYPSRYTKFFEIEKMDKNFDKEQQVTGFREAAIKEEGEEAYFSQLFQGFQKEYRALTYSIGAYVTREMVEDDQYGVIKKIPKLLAESMRQTEEIIAHNVLNNGFTGAGPDGQPLFSTAHIAVAGSTTGLRNRPATDADLSQTSLENAIIDVMDFRDDNDKRIMVEVKKLVVPTALKFVAAKILETEYKVGSADNDKNILANMDIEPIVTPYLTDPDSWFLITNQENGLKFKTRRSADITRDNDFKTQNVQILTTKRFAADYTDWRGAYGCPGA